MLKLFGQKQIKREKGVTTPKVNFEKVVVTTTDLLTTIQTIAKEHRISPKMFDFKILSYKTFRKKEEISEEITTPAQEDLVDPYVTFEQELRVEIFLKDDSSPFPIPMALSANSDFTTIRAVVKPQGNLSYFEGLESEIIAEIERKKVKAGILIGIQDEMMRKSIKKLVAIIRVNGAIAKQTSFVVCEGIPFQEAISNKLIEHYIDEENKHSNTMYVVSKGELVLEIIKSQPGRNGRNCKGEILLSNQVELSESGIEIKVSDDFEIKEEADRILYYAKTAGHISRGVDNSFEIKEELVVDSVSVKTTGDISGGEESEVSVTIREDDSVLDAVGPGVEIDTFEINIAGSVANNAKIKAQKAQIKGQTHQSSYVEANSLQIHLHKGRAEGDIVEINILEGGVVYGDSVKVKQFNGGEIHAQRVYIGEVTSNAKVYASHHIEIDKITGNGNLFVVDASVQRNFQEKYDALNKKLSDVNYKLKKLPKLLKNKKHKIKSESESIAEIQKVLAEIKKYGKKPLAAMTMKLKEHQNRIKEFNSLLQELKDAKLQEETLREELAELNTSVLKAKVIHKSPWKEFNEVKFKLIEPPIEVSFLPKEGEMTRELGLSSTEEGEYNIKRGG